MKKDVFTAWEQDGDLERMRAFFQSVEASDKEKERIKQKVLKNLSQIQVAENEWAMTEDEGKFTLSDRIKSLKWRWKWQMVIPVAAIIMLVFAGQHIINSSKLGENVESKRVAQSEEEMRRTEESADSMLDSLDSEADLATSGPNIGVNDIAGNINSEKSLTDRHYNINFDNEMAASERTGMYGADSANDNNSKSSSLNDAENASKSKSEFNDTSIAKKEVSSGDLPILLTTAPGFNPNHSSGLVDKIAYSYDVSLDVQNIELAEEKVAGMVVSLGGYIAGLSDSESSKIHLIVKVPVNEYLSLLNSLQTLGKVTVVNYYEQNISNEYYQGVIKQQELMKQEENYRALLNSTQSQKEKKSLEEALNKVLEQKEDINQKLIIWENALNYAKVALTIK